MSQMGCKYTRDVKILPSMCDEKSMLSIPAVLDLFQDTATLHADHFDIGPEGMTRRNYFWIITKTRLHINRMPAMMEDIQSNTWIQAPERVSCERDYSITSGDEVLAYGRSIWAIISRDTGKLVHLNELYPVLDFDKDPPDEKPFARISKKFDGAEEIGQYKIRSVDIDLGGHMNNVNYIRAMLGCLKSEEISSLEAKELEVNFISQSYEGDTLTYVKRDSDEGIEFAALDTGGKAVFVAKVI